MSEDRFDISLPALYKDNWREAYRADEEDRPRLTSYQSPDGQPIPFIYENLEFSGGQSVDTAEYPFFGLWSNDTLNLKPQSLNIQGYLRGDYYLEQRTAFLDALMIPTSDNAPGFLDHPLWGRFAVIVENYVIKEAANENGQCAISLTLRRAGVSLETRAAVLSPSDFTTPENVALVAVEEFAKTEKDSATLLQAFGQIKMLLLKGIGAVQAAQTALNTVTNEINGISNLIAQGVQSPMLLSQSLVNSAFSIAGAVISAANSFTAVTKYFSSWDNEKVAVMNFLSTTGKMLPIETITARQTKTKEESENLYRTVNLCASAKILMQMDNITYEEMNEYWNLYTKLENSINLENPDIYEAIIRLRSTLSQTLRQSVMVNELKRTVNKPVPLLLLAHHLGCNDEKLRAMNHIEDSLLISGEVSYV